MSNKENNKGFLDGVVNKTPLYIFTPFPLIYAGAIPVTSYMTQPGGTVEKTLQAMVKYLIPGGSSVPASRMIPAMAAIYAFVTFAATGAWSVAGQASSSAKGLDNNHPRKHVNDLRGLPLRLRSAHYNMMENFSAWALAATLAQTMSAGNAQITNLLGLAMISKVLVHYPCYVFNIAPPRSFGHLFATSAVVNVLLRLAVGA